MSRWRRNPGRVSSSRHTTRVRARRRPNTITREPPRHSPRRPRPATGPTTNTKPPATSEPPTAYSSIRQAFPPAANGLPSGEPGRNIIGPPNGELETKNTPSTDSNAPALCSSEPRVAIARSAERGSGGPATSAVVGGSANNGGGGGGVTAVGIAVAGVSVGTEAAGAVTSVAGVTGSATGATAGS